MKKPLKLTFLEHMMIEEYNEEQDIYYMNNLIVSIIGDSLLDDYKITMETYDVYEIGTFTVDELNAKQSV
jgi:hypothetical protein